MFLCQFSLYFQKKKGPFQRCNAQQSKGSRTGSGEASCSNSSSVDNGASSQDSRRGSAMTYNSQQWMTGETGFFQTFSNGSKES